MINGCITFPKTSLVFFNYIIGPDKARKTIVKSVVNCQNMRDNVVPRMQQWPLDIPQ